MTLIIHTGGGVPGTGGYLGSVLGYESDPTAVPGPADGDRYIVKTPGVDVWAGHDEEIAEYEASTTTWVFTVPSEGDFVVNEDDPDAIYIFDATSSTWVKSDPRAHASTHESGGTDEIDVTGLLGELGEPQLPKTHASTHEDGAADELVITDLGEGVGGPGTVLTKDNPATTYSWQDPIDDIPHAGGSWTNITTPVGADSWIQVTGVAIQLNPTKAADVFVVCTFDVESVAGAPMTIEFGIQKDLEANPPASAEVWRRLQGPAATDIGAVAVQRQDTGAGPGTIDYRLYVYLAAGEQVKFNHIQLSAFTTKVE